MLTRTLAGALALVLCSCAPASIRLPVSPPSLPAVRAMRAATAAADDSPPAGCAPASSVNFWSSVLTPFFVALAGGSGVGSLAAEPYVQGNNRLHFTLDAGVVIFSAAAGATTAGELWTRAWLAEHHCVAPSPASSSEAAPPPPPPAAAVPAPAPSPSAP